MDRKLRGAALFPGAAWLAMLCACPQSPPPGGGGCAGESEACATSSDCCGGLSCVDAICVTSPAECAAEGQACADAADCCEGLDCVADACAAPKSGNPPALPSKTIALDLIGIHDAESDASNGDCIGCHGDRTDEVSLDGSLPAAHAVMQTFFGTGNDRCTSCHNGGPDFLTRSAGSLREQVSMADVGCANCHGANAIPSLYAK